MAKFKIIYRSYADWRGAYGVTIPEEYAEVNTIEDIEKLPQRFKGWYGSRHLPPFPVTINFEDKYIAIIDTD